MGLFEQFPYTNYHDLNLDWIIKTLKMVATKCETLNDLITNFDSELQEAVKTAIDDGEFNGLLSELEADVYTVSKYDASFIRSKLAEQCVIIVDDDINISTDAHITALIVPMGGVIHVNGYTVTIDTIYPIRMHVVDSAVALTGVVYPEWFGARSGIDDSSAFNMAVASLKTGGEINLIDSRYDGAEFADTDLTYHIAHPVYLNTNAVTLKASNRAIVKHSSWPAVIIGADNEGGFSERNVLANIHFVYSGTTCFPSDNIDNYTVIMRYATRCEIRDCRFNYKSNAVACRWTTNCLVESCEVHYLKSRTNAQTSTGIRVFCDDERADLSCNASLRLVNNRVNSLELGAYENDVAIKISGRDCRDIYISGNETAGCGIGVLVDNSGSNALAYDIIIDKLVCDLYREKGVRIVNALNANVIISNCWISSSDVGVVGIEIDNSAYVTISANIVQGNMSESCIGIQAVNGSNNITIAGNVVFNPSTGIRLVAKQCAVVGNTVSRNAESGNTDATGAALVCEDELNVFSANSLSSVTNHRFNEGLVNVANKNSFVYNIFASDFAVTLWRNTGTSDVIIEGIYKPT